MKKYVAIGGPVYSADGDRHYVGPARICRLYGVAPGSAILIADYDDPNLRGLRLDDYVVLQPDPSGRYELP